MNEEEKKVIEELSKKAVICNYEERDYPNMICFKKDMIIALNLIEKLQKENEELKNKLLDTLEGQKVIKEETPQYIKENYISKEEVKDKIEELKQEKGKHGNCLIEMYEDELVNRDIKILQELIEEREEK